MDGTEGQQDTTSAETTGTSEKEPETFTKEQHEEGVRKAKSDALSDVGRYKTSADNAIKAVQKAEERINRMLKESDEAELEANRDKPEAISAIKERQARRIVESELAQVTQELDTEKLKTAEVQEAGAKQMKEINAREVASRLSVDAKTLIKFTDGSTEAMEELAKSLNSKGTTKTLVTDSGKTIGGGGKGKTPTLEELRASTPWETDEKVKKGEWKL